MPVWRGREWKNTLQTLSFAGAACALVAAIVILKFLVAFAKEHKDDEILWSPLAVTLYILVILAPLVWLGWPERISTKSGTTELTEDED